MNGTLKDDKVSNRDARKICDETLERGVILAVTAIATPGAGDFVGSVQVLMAPGMSRDLELFFLNLLLENLPSVIAARKNPIEENLNAN